MGDIWPYGKPRFTTYVDAVVALEARGMPHNDALIGAAIGEAESSLDLSVINDTPSTGDYSVGVWQINYAGSLWAGRVRAFGTPEQLIRGGLKPQSHAVYTLWRESGFTPWSTFNSGAYRQYLSGNVQPSIRTRRTYVPVPPPTKPGADSWAAQVKGTAGHLEGAAHTLANAGNAIELIRR